jgi:3-oxoacid CoA-transferase subunit A
MPAIPPASVDALASPDDGLWGEQNMVSRTVDKVVASPAVAVADIGDGASLAVGGFGLSGIPSSLIKALQQTSSVDLRVVSNNCGTDGSGLGVLLDQHRIARITASYVGENREFARQYLAGEVEVELTPQGTLAERMRAGGVGIPAFFTPAGVGTLVADGGLPWRYDTEGTVVVASPPKETRTFDLDGDGSRIYVLEEAIVTDFALVRAWKGDRAGNLVYREAARNFNPLCAMAGRVTIAEVEHLVEPGELDPENVHTPGVFVQRVVTVDPDDVKDIEKRTTRPRLAERSNQ